MLGVKIHKLLSCPYFQSCCDSYCRFSIYSVAVVAVIVVGCVRENKHECTHVGSPEMDITCLIFETALPVYWNLAILISIGG